MFIFGLPRLILIAAAVIPALVLLVYVYRQDRAEKEPWGLLGMLVLQGILATTLAKAAEYAGSALVDLLTRPGSVLNRALLYFGVVAFAEEGAKYLLLKRRTWNLPDFDHRFDGVVYAVSVSLGFALWENIGYVIANGLGVAMVRAITAVPGHASFGVYMGCWYARAYEAWRAGDAQASSRCRAMALVLPALLHGAYDFLADLAGDISPWVFVAFVAGLFWVTFHLVRRLSREDAPV